MKQPRKKYCPDYKVHAGLALLFVVCSHLLLAQSSVDSATNFKDSARAAKVKLLQALGKRESQSSLDKFQAERINLRQNDLLAQVQATLRNAKNYLKTNFDTTAIEAELEQVEKWHTIAGDGIFTNKGSAQTHRNLTTSKKLIGELYLRVTNLKIATDIHQKKLTSFQYQIDSLYSDPALYVFSSDSVTVTRYIKRLVTAAKEILPTDSALNHTIERTELLQYKIDTVSNKLSYSLEEINGYEKDLFDNTFKRDFPNIWDETGYNRNFSEIISYSWKKSSLAMFFYMENHAGRLFLSVLIICGIMFFLRSLKSILEKQGNLHEDFKGQLVLRYPFLSAYVIGVNLLQFIFPDPPFAFDAFVWMTSAIALTFILRHFITAHWMRVWLTLLILFALVAVVNILLQASRMERWMMLLLSLTGVIFPLAVVFSGRRNELREKAILYFIGFIAVLELPSLFENIFGRYNISKTLFVSGFANVVIAILFLWVIRLINEGLRLAYMTYSHQDIKLFYINFEKVGDKVPNFFYVLLVFGWFILFGRNFYAFRVFTNPFIDFLASERTVGDFTFTISNIFLFVLILGLATVASKLVSFFASDSSAHHTSSKDKKKAGLGSWLLLIRIFIIGLGVFFAFAATGIPMDKITIILGALSVGIGLGLQGLVNNLVSGLILAFEKPVNVGDLVDVVGQSGRMKSIGFRSSVIATGEGADVIIPNGELLNSKMVNWTMGKNNRRGEIIVGVGFESDLEKVTSLVTGILKKNDRLMKHPAPSVLLKDFNSSAIEVQLFFWVQDINDLSVIKSDIIKSIKSIFHENGIEIPYPQQDIHIRTDLPPNKDQQSPMVDQKQD